MDVIALQKASKAKKEMKALSDRLGGAVQSTFPNVKSRLDDHFNKMSLNSSEIIIDSNEKWNKGIMNGVASSEGALTGTGSWVGDIELESGILFDRISIQTKIIPVGDYSSLVAVSPPPAPIVVSQAAGGIFGPQGSYKSPWGTYQNTYGVIDFASPKKVSKYSLSTVRTDSSNTTLHLASMPREFHFEGSNDNSSWTRLDTRQMTTADWGTTVGTSVYVRQFEFTNNASYRYYRFHFVRILSNETSYGNFNMGPALLYEMAALEPIYVNNDFTSADITIDTGKGYEALGTEGLIQSKFKKNFKIKVQSPVGKPLSLSKLCIGYKSIPKNKMVSELEASTSINMNKHNLRVSSLLNQSRYKLTDMVIDDFKDESGIDKSKSSNYALNTSLSKIQVQEGKEEAEVVMIAEQANVEPGIFLLSESSSSPNVVSKIANLSDGLYVNTQLNNGNLELTMKSQSNFYEDGSYETTLDLGDNLKSLNGIVVEAANQVGVVTVLTSTSLDNATYSEYTEVSGDGAITSPEGRYVKIKVVLLAREVASEVTAYSFVASDASKFNASEMVTYDGSLKLNKSFGYAMNKDDSFSGGTLFRCPIDKSKFKSIGKVSVE